MAGSVEFNPNGDLEYDYAPINAAEWNRIYQTQAPEESILNAMYPAAMRSYAGSWLGDEGDITQHRFSPSELNALQQDYLTKRANYTAGFDGNPLTGFQKGRIPDVSHIVPYDQYSQENAMPEMQGWGSMFSGIKPFSQGAYYEQSPEGTRLRNYYTTPYGQRDVNVLLPMEPIR